MLKRILHWLAGSPPRRAHAAVRVPPVQTSSPRPTTAAQPEITSLPRTQRLFMEQQVLVQRFPGFQWQRDGDDARVEGTIRTSAGQAYSVRLLVPEAFPFTHPRAFVVSPIRGNGCSLNEASHSMHTLSSDSDDHPQICLYNDRNWDPSLTLQHVLVKAAVWLEAYEQHRRTGRPISDFLASVR